MNGVKDKSDGYVRKTSPADGWMIRETPLLPQAEARFKTNASTSTAPCCNGARYDVIAKGDMVQFMPQQGVYVFARMYQGKTVMVLLNGTNKEVNLPLHFYAEILQGKTQGKEIIKQPNGTATDKLTLEAKGSSLLNYKANLAERIKKIR